MKQKLDIIPAWKYSAKVKLDIILAQKYLNIFSRNISAKIGHYSGRIILLLLLICKKCFIFFSAAEIFSNTKINEYLAKTRQVNISQKRWLDILLSSEKCEYIQDNYVPSLQNNSKELIVPFHLKSCTVGTKALSHFFPCLPFFTRISDLRDLVTCSAEVDRVRLSLHKALSFYPGVYLEYSLFQLKG